MKIGIYLGDIKKPNSLGRYTFEMSFVDELLKQDTQHEYVFYYFGKKNIFQNTQRAKFVSLKYYKKPLFSLFPFQIKFVRTPIFSLNHILKKDCINLVCFLTPYLHEHIELPYFAIIRNVSHRILPHFPEFSTDAIFEKREKHLNLFLTSASKIITCNNVSKNDIKTLYDVILDNISTIALPPPNWVKNIKADNSVLDKCNLTKNSYILYPAQFWTYKNHVRLILAKQIMKEQNINLKVVFCGLDRGNKKYLLNKVSKLDLEDEILFLDYVCEEELAALYQNAFALVYPCLAGVDSIVALEALYFDLPVLISDHIGYHQQLKKSALYFNPLDEGDIVKKIQMLNDLAIRDDLIANGKILIKENDCRKYIENFLNIVDSFYLTRQCWSLKESYKNK